MKKTDLKAKVEQIYSMNEEQVQEFLILIGLSDVDKIAKEFLYRSCEDRLLQLSIPIEVEMSELRFDEVQQ